MEKQHNYVERIFIIGVCLTGLIIIAQFSSLSSVLANTPNLTGTYAGTVAIASPVQLGVLDLAFDLTDTGGNFTGRIDEAKTLVFEGGPDLSGSITGATNGITPTFTINSALFTSQVSNRTVQRQITLTGEVLENGDLLQGEYTEVLSGFTPQPLVSRGIFLVSRATQSLDVTAQPALLLQVSPTTLPLNGSAQVQATLLDGNSQPVSGVDITFSTSLGNVTPGVVTTNSEGMATATFSAGDAPGSATITATGGGFTAERTVTITDGTLTLQSGAEQLVFNAQTTVTAIVRDAANNPVGGETVNFSSNALGAVSPTEGVTDSNGQASTTFTASSVEGEAIITAQTTDMANTKSIQIVAKLDSGLNTYLPIITKN